MEKDKLSILDVCGAYGQKDIENLDRSGPARSGVGWVYTKFSWNASVRPFINDLT